MTWALSVDGWQDRHDLGDSWHVGIVTVDTVIPEAWSSAQIPVPGHASVEPELVVAVLGTMALSAELKRLFSRDGLAGGEVQLGWLTVHVAMSAGKLAMPEGHPIVKLIELCHRLGKRSTFLYGMTSDACNADNPTHGVLLP